MQMPGSFRGVSLKKLRRDASAWIAVGLFVILMSGIYVQMYKKYKTYAVQATAKRSQIRIARDSGLAEIGAADLAKLQNGVAAFKNGFIKSAELPTMLDGLSDEAARNDVQVVSVDQSAPAGAEELPEGAGGTGPAYKRLPIHMKLQGSTRSIGNFLRALEKSSKRIFVVEALRLTKPRPNSAVLDCELTISYFSNHSG